MLVSRKMVAAEGASSEKKTLEAALSSAFAELAAFRPKKLDDERRMKWEEIQLTISEAAKFLRSQLYQDNARPKFITSNVVDFDSCPVPESAYTNKELLGWFPLEALLMLKAVLLKTVEGAERAGMRNVLFGNGFMRATTGAVIQSIRHSGYLSQEFPDGVPIEGNTAISLMKRAARTGTVVLLLRQGGVEKLEMWEPKRGSEYTFREQFDDPICETPYPGCDRIFTTEAHRIFKLSAGHWDYIRKIEVPGAVTLQFFCEGPARKVVVEWLDQDNVVVSQLVFLSAANKEERKAIYG